MRLLRLAGFAVSSSLAAWACGNAGDSLATGVGATNTINAGAFFDRDGSGAFNNPDTVLAGVRINLVSPAGTRVIQSGLTDASGVVSFHGVEVGRYSIVVDTGAKLGDSLGFTGAAPAEVTIIAQGPPQNIAASYGFPTSTIQAARGLAVGTRVLVRGGVLAGRVTFSDSTAYISDLSAAIRLTAATGAISLPGDSVRVIGTIGTRDGQPVIADAQFGYFLIAPGDPPTVPYSVSTNVAAHAAGGGLDASLVLVSGATIIDTSTVGSDFVVQVDDGTGVLDVVFDLAVNPPATPAAPGATLRASGVLVPATGSIWQLKPRETADVTIN